MFVDTILGGVNRLSGAEHPERWLADWVRGGIETTSGEHVSEDTALTCAAVKACVCVLAETVASLPIDVYQETKSGSKSPAPDHPVAQLLSREPNPEMSSYIWRETKQGHLGTWGNGYSEIVRNVSGSKVVGLNLRSPRPQHTRPIRGEDGQMQYECRNEMGTLEKVLPAADMLHIPGFGFDGLVGYSPIGLIREAIGGNKAAERYANELFANDGAQRGFFEHPAQLSQEAHDRLKASMVDGPKRHGERHKTQILEEGMKFANNSMNPEDVQMIDARRFGIEEIARAYRISPHLLQDLTHGTFSNITELGRQFIVYTMMPWLKRWKGEIDRKLLKPPYYCQFNVAAFLQGDHAARSAFYRELFGIGALTINDILRLEDRNPIGKDGDIRFVPLNMVPLEVAAAGPQPKPASEPPKTSPATPPTPPADVPPEAPAKQAAGNGEALKAAEAVVAETLRRMERIEANEALRAAKEPKTFIARLDTFYPKHVETMREALAGPLRTTLLLNCRHGDVCLEPELSNLINEHVAGKRAALLASAECKPSELPGRVAECVKDWGKPTEPNHPAPESKGT